VRWFLLVVLLLTSGCQASPVTASPVEAAAGEERPILIIGGWGDVGFNAMRTRRGLQKLLPKRRFITINPGLERTFDDAAAKVVNRLEREAVGEGEETIEVDVIGISMGGLVARHAATQDARFGEAKKRLNICRLFTIVTPHSGAQLADEAGFFGTSRDMRSASPFLQLLTQRELDTAEERQYPIVAYARTRDRTVGPLGAALPEHWDERSTLIWIKTPFWQTGHAGAAWDRRILTDRSRRLERASAGSP
jgi:pimeloyl-ACP methyl ester carboxylesterase